MCLGTIRRDLFQAATLLVTVDDHTLQCWGSFWGFFAQICICGQTGLKGIKLHRPVIGQSASPHTGVHLLGGWGALRPKACVSFPRVFTL